MIITNKKSFVVRVITIILVSEIGTAFMLIPFSITGSCGPVSFIDWTKTWGGSDQEILYEMEIDSSGDFIIAGEIWSYSDTFNDIFVVKINKTYACNATWGDVMQQEFSGMALDSNENIFIIGTSTDHLPEVKEVFLLKYSNNLTLEWYDIWGGIVLESSSGIAIDSQDNIYISGMMNYPACDVFLAKYNNSGVLQWNCTWNMESNNISEEAVSFVIDSMDNVFLGVKTNLTDSKWFLLKYNSSGVMLLNCSYNKYIPVEQLVIDSFDDLYALGSANSTYLTKLNNEGNVVWNLTCIQNVLKGTEKLVLDSSDNVFVLGNELINASAIVYGYIMTDYDTYMMKLYSNSSLAWNHTISYGNNIYPELLKFDPFGNIYFGGSLEMIAPGYSLGYEITVYDHLGKGIISHGGGCSKGDDYCKGIYARSSSNFTAVINSPCGEEGDYNIRLVNYIEPDFSHCPPDPDPLFLGILQLGISSLFIAIGIIYLIKNEKRKNRI